ncbi:MAG: hypothetical protein M1820_007718 [Bogoriella megaspora]|nr:MAG: hypothetical protein M1820_007718 [Bogoriella megaspora]
MLSSFLSPSLLVLLAPRIATAEPFVTVEQHGVSYRGIITGSVEHFKNIKFAHDTSGHRRFAPPEPFLPEVDTIVDATSPGAACPQIKDALPPFFSATERISEDCLNLYIARPAGSELSSRSKLPVLVWIHGGGVVKGSAYDEHTAPDKLIELSIADRKPVIFVAINYRLTIFGFARSVTLKDDQSLNVGMRDQRLALEWIESNIQAFGGDPDRITVYGLSSGGTFTSLQQLAYGGERGAPFQQAWMMSGPPGTAVNTTSNATAVHTAAVAERLGCDTSHDAKMISCLREVDMQTLLDTAMEYSTANHPPNGLFTFIPSVDGDFLPDRPVKLYRRGKFVRGIRSVFGWTQDDGAINAGLGHLIKSEEDMIAPIKNFYHALTKDHIFILFSLYPAEDFEEDVQNYEARKKPEDPDISVHYFRLSRVLRDLLFTCSSLEFSMYMVTKCLSNADGVRLYALNQSALNPIWDPAGMPYVGVSHGSDTNYIFNGLFPEGNLSEDDLELSKAFTRSLISFAYTGDPQSADSFPDWPPVLDNICCSENEVGKAMPPTANMLVIGGPLGTRPVSMADISTADARRRYGVTEMGDQEALGVENMPELLINVPRYGGMESSQEATLKKNVERQNLLERCSFINSLEDMVLGDGY